MYFAGQATMALYPKLTSGTQIGIAAENYDRNLVSGINDNQAKWISLDDNGGEDYDLVKTHNYSTHIEIPANKSITIDLNGFTIDAKKALTSSVFDVKGTLTVKDSSADHDGMMYSKKDTLVCSNVTFEGNKAGTEKVKREEYAGGGIIVDNRISAKITHCTFKDNWGKYDGGGIEVENDAKAVIENSTFTGNACVQHGTAIHVRDRGYIYLKDVTVTGNEGNHAVWVNEDLHVSGKIEIHDNEGDDLFLNDDEPIVLESKLTAGSRIGVVLEDGTGTFTKNYKKYHGEEDPAICFYAGKDGYSIKTDKNGEAKVIASDWIDLQRSFSNASGETTVQLTKDYKADDSDNTLTIEGEKNIILDLNGYTIDGDQEIGSWSVPILSPPTTQSPLTLTPPRPSTPATISALWIISPLPRLGAMISRLPLLLSGTT